MIYLPRVKERAFLLCNSCTEGIESIILWLQMVDFTKVLWQPVGDVLRSGKPSHQTHPNYWSIGRFDWGKEMNHHRDDVGDAVVMFISCLVQDGAPSRARVNRW